MQLKKWNEQGYKQRTKMLLVTVDVRMNGEAKRNPTETRQSSNCSGIRIVGCDESHYASTD